MRNQLLTLALAGFSAVTLVAQEKQLTCDKRGNWNDKVGTCEIREQSIPFAGRLAVDAGKNGGISVKGWDRADVLVRAKVEAWGDTEADAKSLATQIRLDTSAGVVKPSGPESKGWAVSFEIFVPRRGDLNLNAYNGGIGIDGVTGRIQFKTTNGGVHLTRLGGDVEGKTTNGGVHVELAGARWEGQKLDVETKNGGVNMTMPANYSAQLETETVNGSVKVDFPMTVKGDLTNKKISTTIGSGGPTIRVVTVNGGVKVNRS
jgi:DUF4097 and DUF4098 domain-containing protein YvlB